MINKNEKAQAGATAKGQVSTTITEGYLTMNSIQPNVAISTVPVIAGVEITTDAAGRFNLNALHKAAGSIHTKRPSIWLATKQAKELIEELSQNSGLGQKVISSVKGGVTPGTFAHELLAVSYAGWISPAFQLQVNQAFIDFRSGRLVKTSPAVLPNAKELAMMVIAAEEEKEQLLLVNKQLEHQVEEATPKVEFHDKVVAAPGAMSIAQAAKILGTGRTRLFSFLRSHGWVTRRNEPYQEKIEAGLMDVKLGSWDHPEHGVQQSITSLITGKGLAALQKLLSVDGLH